MTPRDILDLADDLCGGPSEAFWRGAVSRACYAAFHTARVLFRGAGFTVPRAEAAHAYLWLRLENSDHPDVKAAGAELNDLRKMRNWADYDLDDPFDHANAVVQVQAALGVVDLLEDVMREPVTRDRITSAMRVYERDVLKETTWRAPSAGP
jgi:uncharacterized protein (UPF0332 family)